MTFAMGGAPAPGSDRIPVELFQILKDDALESAALNMPANLENSAVVTHFIPMSLHPHWAALL